MSILFIICNNANEPFTNVDIYNQAQLEKDFTINYKRDVEIPEKPKMAIKFTSIQTHVIKLKHNEISNL